MGRGVGVGVCQVQRLCALGRRLAGYLAGFSTSFHCFVRVRLATQPQHSVLIIIAIACEDHRRLACSHAGLFREWYAI